MACFDPIPYYLPHTTGGIETAINRGEGQVVAVSWTKAYASSQEYSLAYALFYSTEIGDTFSEGVKFLSIDPAILVTEITELTPGDTYYFGVRAVQYLSEWYNPQLLPDSGSSKYLPEGFLLTELDEQSIEIPITNIDLFPSYGVVQIGSELIRYLNVDLQTSSLINLTRGFLSTDIRIHQLDGYDGYLNYDNPAVRFWPGYSEKNNKTLQETSAFHYPNFAYVNSDGYRREKDLVNTDLSLTDESQADFPSYDYVGWHRTDPSALLRGECLDTYIGGEYYCADGYGQVGAVVRGMPVNDVSNMREEMLLDALGTGETCVLVKKNWLNVQCKCVLPNSEIPDERCPVCLGSGKVYGYEQFYNPRRSDGRILVRFGPTIDDLKAEEPGIETVFVPDCWTLTFPAIKDSDFLIRFQEDGITEEFRYEIINVTRNKMFFSQYGAQKFTAHRVKKTDPIYQWRYFSNTATIPTLLSTTVSTVLGPGNVPLVHQHTVHINEGITMLSQIDGSTDVSLQGITPHNHLIVQGQVLSALDHTHSISFP